MCYDAIRMPRRMVPADGRDMVSRAKRVLAALAAAVLAVTAALSVVGCDGAAAAGGGGTLKVGVRSDIVNFSLLNEQTGK